MKELINRIPILRSLARFAYFTFVIPFKKFPGSDDYWKERYRSGGNSGPGSYSRHARYKAEILNEFVKARNVKTIIEYGCGDGNQLRSSAYPSYVGFDVSPEAIALCRNIFSGDSTKTFKLVEEYTDEKADLTMSLDVVYHLTEDDVFSTYMQLLFDSATRYVIVYSSNTDTQEKYLAPHLKHRAFSKWIEQHKPDWQLLKHIPNESPFTGDNVATTFAEFYIYEKV